jgi:putative transposase
MSKCDEYGINLIMTEESYTSKCSFIDHESIEHQEEYLGRRVKRGLFRSKENILLNADINGACNIIRKVFPEFKYEGIEGFIVSPEVLNIN